MYKRFTAHLFYKIGLLVALFSLVLSGVVFYVVEYYYTDQDTILDAQELFFYGQLVDSWSFPEDTVVIKNEIDNLRLNASIFNRDSSAAWFYPMPVNPDGFLVYADSDDFEALHGVVSPLFVSHGSNMDGNFLTYVQKDSFHVFLYTEEKYGPEYVNYFPPFVVSVIFMLIINLFIRRFLQPIQWMKKRIRGLRRGDMKSQISVRGNDELAELSMSINKMIGDIKSLLSQKQQLLLDVSHELRSPLARIRLLTEMLPEHKNKNKLVDEVVFLEGMISNLLYSDKLSLPYTNMQVESIKVSNFIVKVMDLINVDLKKFNINNSIPSTFVDMDETKMIIATRNLIDNALKYGDQSKKITINLLQKKQLFCMEILNYGSTIEGDELSDIFLPFFRSKDNKNTVSGFGLGLTICKKIVGAHSGQLLMTSDGGVTTFSIEIPIKKE